MVNPELSGLGFWRLPSVTQDQMKTIVNLMRGSPRCVCAAVAELPERNLLLRDVARKVVLWGKPPGPALIQKVEGTRR